MPLKGKISLAATAACIAAGVVGASPASAATINLHTGLNSPKGSNTVVLPQSATPGGVNAFTQVTTKGPGDLSNINVTFTP